MSIHEQKSSIFGSDDLSIDLERVDFSNSESVEGSGHFIASALRNADISEFISLEEKNSLRDVAEVWIKKVELKIDQLKGREIQDCLEWYDIVHRMVFSKPAKFSFIYGYMHRAMMDLAKGGDTDKLRLMRWTKNALYFHANDLDSKIIQWRLANIEKWVKKFVHPGSVGINLLGDDDTLRIVNILLEENLYQLVVDQKSFKRRLIKKGLPLLDFISENKIDDLRLSRIQWEALVTFASLSLKEFPGIDYDKIRGNMLKKLVSDDSLDLYSRKAYALDLEYESYYNVTTL